MPTPRTPRPNRYGMAAMRAGEDDPVRPVSLFHKFGEEAADAILDLESQLGSQVTPDEPWMSSVGRLYMARLMAEEAVVSELLTSTSTPQEAEPATDVDGAWVGPSPALGRWTPVLDSDAADDQPEA